MENLLCPVTVTEGPGLTSYEVNRKGTILHFTPEGEYDGWSTSDPEVLKALEN